MPTLRVRVRVNIYVHVQLPLHRMIQFCPNSKQVINTFSKRNDYSFAIILVILYTDLSQLLLVQQEKCNVEMEQH